MLYHMSCALCMSSKTLLLRSQSAVPLFSAGQVIFRNNPPSASAMSKDTLHSKIKTAEVVTAHPEPQNGGALDTRPVKKRENYISWEEYFMSVAFLSAQRSKDPSSQVGACIVDEENKIVGIGYNGMPTGCSDDELPWAREGLYLETKYPYVVHAEQNAIMNRNAASLKNCIVYVGLFPCNECAKLCIQAGIKEIVFVSDKYKDQEVFIASRRLLDMAGIKYRQFIPRSRSIVLNFDVIDPALFAAQT
ncbi:hypothetical protein RvY_15790 [Ramazzottius varieornatus]|uniref:Probable deoxycytidylate deaminase n=1 Tax=Ramazzottius varieornatus TaxID=947166 RepID=A0A1D1W0R1_RAMVA|nr:hypothetical protein RvY_15790 [Ramazzottius varieornatus]